MTPRYLRHAIGACAVLVLAMWLSSGTLSPYGSTVGSYALEPCHYLVNIDHVHHIAPFYMLRGAPPGYWAPSVVLRRVLYPVLAYAFTRVAGFLVGGLICNVLITLVAMIAFSRFVATRFGEWPAIAMLWLLATYPGITYWAGLPYSYAAIVPACLLAAMQLYRLDTTESVREVVAASLMIGILFLAYDLFPFLLPSVVLVLLFRRKPVWALLAPIVAVVPMILTEIALARRGVPPMNANTATYLHIVEAYLHPDSLRAWGGYLLRIPLVLVANFFDSNFFFLPLLAVVAAVLCRSVRRCVGRVEAAIFLSALAVFVFNNAAPPYYGWQMRGVWIARLYQPVFVALLLCIARALATGLSLRLPIIITVVANAMIVLGPVMMNPAGLYFDWRFYQHAPRATFAELLHIYGRRPLGFCRPSHEGDELPPAPRELMLPPYAFRFRIVQR